MLVGKRMMRYPTVPASAYSEPWWNVAVTFRAFANKSSSSLPKHVPSFLLSPQDEPPRFMGEGFVVMSSHDTRLHYYQDQPGYVPFGSEGGGVAGAGGATAGGAFKAKDGSYYDGDAAPSDQKPYWGVNIKCGKGTNLSYGPWADRQRDHLYKFFFPSDYQIQNPTELPRPGQLRIVHKFDFKLSMQEGIETLDLLFLNKDNDLCAIHSKCDKGKVE